MAISVVSTTAANTLTVTIPATSAGNCLVVCLGTFSGGGAASISGITLGGSAGNFAQVLSNTAHAEQVFIWADPNCAGGQTSVVISGTNLTVDTADGGVVIFEVSGLASTFAALVDKIASNASNTGTAWSSGSTAATTQASELWVGVVASDPGVSTVPGAYTNTINTGSFSAAGWQIVSATGAAVYNGTQGSSNIWAAGVATFFAASSAAPSGTVQPEATVPTRRRKRGRAAIVPGAVATTNPAGPAGTVQPGAAMPAARRKPARAWLKFTPVVNTGIVSGPAGKVQPETATPAPRRKPGRAWLRFTPVATTNATGSAGKVQPSATVPTPRRKRRRAISAGLAVPGVRGTAPRQQYQAPPRRKRQRAWVQFTPVPGASAGRQLLVSLASQAGTDDYGNSFPQGVFASAGVIEGPTIIGSDAFFYTPTPAFGNLTQTVTEVSGTDAYGNAYIAGTATYANNGSFWSAVVVDSGVVTWYKADGAGGPWTAEAGIGFNWNNLTGGGLSLTAPAGISGALNIPQSLSGSIQTLPTDGNSGTAWVSGERAFMNNNWVNPINSNFAAIVAALNAAGIAI